ncbi:hypothetical protein MPSEU_000134600 [Mayamaea pseudoterrestris]|nr:hypothetical protein MPSEU_000134600 [Mayamaea pseudoterrestris]
MEIMESLEPTTAPYEDVLSAEKMALVDFVYSLGSSNVNTEPGIADDGTTRQEAELLMSLLSSSPSSLEQLDMDPVSSSESEHSFEASSADEESLQHRPSSIANRTRSFRFTCPSLSLEHLERSAPSHSKPAKINRIVSDNGTQPSPATLLERNLQVKDVDALRLSADAMALNVRLTIQKALQFRIDSWIRACSLVLVEKENALRKSGASKEEIKNLLQTQEALVIQSLLDASKKILVTSTVTSFEVLGPSEANDSSSMPASKKQRVEDPSELEEGDYQFKASYNLVLKVIAALETPAGFSEIAIDVPGVIEGTFLTTESDKDDLKSVAIEINTKLLAAMVEKSTRTVVRVSVATLLETSMEIAKEEKSEEQKTSFKHTPGFLTPQKTTLSPSVTAEDVRSALVTPGRPWHGTPAHANNDEANLSSPMPSLWPIPDSLSRSTLERSKDPRRVSPQLNGSPEPPQGKPSSFLIPRRALFQHNESAMVTPSVDEASKHYYEDHENGPSLPLLVAAACQVMENRC